MKIGNITLKNKLILAPMAGVSDSIFREICYSFGASLTVTEMVSAKGLFYDSQATGELLEPSGIHPESAQIFGSSPEIMAKELASPLFEPFDIIDINMGCPARKIVSNNEGSALMNDIPLAYEIIAACVSASQKPVTVKMRSGWDSPCAEKLAVAAERAGAAAVTVHGRTTLQGYSGKADLDIIRRVKESVSIPVIGNGDVTDGASAQKMLEYTGCDAVMIGRAAEGRPWIFAEILAYMNGTEFSLSKEEKLEIAKHHGTGLAALRGERTAMLQMRKHLSWYTHGMRNASSVRANISTVNTLMEFTELIDRLKKQPDAPLQ